MLTEVAKAPRAEEAADWLRRLFWATMALAGAAEACESLPPCQVRVLRKEWLRAQCCYDLARAALLGIPAPESLLRQPEVTELLRQERGSV